MGDLFILCFNTKQAPTTLYHTAETLVAANKVCYYILRTYIVVSPPLFGTQSQHIPVYISPVHYVCMTACMLKYVIPEWAGGIRRRWQKLRWGRMDVFMKRVFGKLIVSLRFIAQNYPSRSLSCLPLINKRSIPLIISTSY